MSETFGGRILSFPSYQLLQLIDKLLSCQEFYHPYIGGVIPGYKPGPHLLLCAEEGRIYLCGNGMYKEERIIPNQLDNSGLFGTWTNIGPYASNAPYPANNGGIYSGVGTYTISRMMAMSEFVSADQSNPAFDKQQELRNLFVDQETQTFRGPELLCIPVQNLRKYLYNCMASSDRRIRHFYLSVDEISLSWIKPSEDPVGYMGHSRLNYIDICFVEPRSCISSADRSKIEIINAPTVQQKLQENFNFKFKRQKGRK